MFKSWLCLILLIISILAQTETVRCQTNPYGIPLIRNYSPEQYNAHSQNWAIVKDKRGFMYFGNNFGLLQYNGCGWKLYKNLESSSIRSLAIDTSGFVYYGASQDFGLMIPDSVGNLKTYSLYKVYSKSDADFNDIWCINIIDNVVFFQSNEKIFSLKLPFDTVNLEKTRKNFKVFLPENAFHWSFSVYNKFYVREFGKGLLFLDNGKLELVPGGEVFANERIYSMLPFQNNKILICSREKGLYIFDPQAEKDGINKFDCQANDMIISGMVYGGAALPLDRFAISTLNNGVIIINSEGEIVEHLNMESGLPDQQVYTIYSDKGSGNLWFATAESGIFNVNTGSPFREWNKHNGLNGVVADIIRFKNTMYIATSTGVYYLDENRAAQSEFVPIKEIPFESWDFELIATDKANDQKLLVATANGIFEIKDRKAKQILKEGYIFQLLQSKFEKNLVYLAYLDGFGALEYNQKSAKWKFLGKNEHINQTIRNIYEHTNRNIYLGTQVSGFIRLKSLFDTQPHTIDSAQGLPVSGSDFKVLEIEGDIVFATAKGLFYYLDNVDSVKPFYKFGTQYSNQDYGVFNIQPENGNYWVSLYSNKLNKGIWQGIVKFYKKDGKYLVDDGFSKPIPQKAVLAMFNDSNYFWLANEKGLYTFDKLKQKNYHQAFNINILSVTTADDSVLFAGTFNEHSGSGILIGSVQPAYAIPELKYKYNQITFEYAASFFEQEENTLYSYRLIGLSDKWSKWSNETKFPFTNLSPGDYRFEVQAKNIYGTLSNVATYEFTILPPWYRTILAYILFVIAASALVWLIVKLNIKRLQMEKERLEGIVAERTTEIRMKNVELEQQKEEIMAQRDEIEEQRDRVTLQKEQIEEQKKSITDSIHYASRIQAALLPPEHVLDELLPEYFIIFRPRDIVSGDFYWTTKKSNKTILVAADCTGHGVPGAFMSMLGISYLNEIMNKYHHLSANQILDELRESVKKSLRQTGKDDEAKDGMDMALCILDYENMNMEYAGAYNSLLLIRDDQIIKYEADRMPIGIYHKEKGGFTNHIIEIRKGDNFYIFSDGYVDQFGGEQGTKLMSKRFKDLLLQHHQKPVAEQKKALEDFLERWQSFENASGETYKQLDDILVIGLKI